MSFKRVGLRRLVLFLAFAWVLGGLFVLPANIFYWSKETIMLDQWVFSVIVFGVGFACIWFFSKH